MKKLLFFILLLSELAVAQNIFVSQNEKVLSSDSKYYFPSLSQDGSKIAYSTQNFVGLYVYDIKTKKHKQVSNKQGAGYNPVFSDNSEKIFYKWNEYEGIKKYSSIFSKNLINNKMSIIESKKRKLSNPKSIANKLIYAIDGNYKEVDVSANSESHYGQTIWTNIENQKIVLYKNNKKVVLSPKGEGNYIWPSLSPDKTKILFTFAGHGTYISDLEGNIISELEYLNAPKWLNNDWVIGMKDYDNGEFVTHSDIYAIKSNGKNLTRLTETDDSIEMYPECSINSSRVVYHTLSGDIYLMTLKFK